MKFSLKQIIGNLHKNSLDISVNDNTDFIIDGINTLNKSTKSNLTFFHNIKYKKELINTKAAACLIHSNYLNFIPKSCTALITNQPYKGFILTLSLFYPPLKSNGQITKKCSIHKSSKIGKNVEIQDGVIIKDNVYIGDNSIICSNSVIGENVNIEDNVIIYDNCCIKNCFIGNNSEIQAGVILGSNGFGFAIEKDNFENFTHIGKVIIGNNVKIGSNSTIARGSLEDTIVGNNVRIDNQVHIAHNVQIGDNCLIAGQSGIAGSTILGKNIMIGGQVGISGHLNIGDNVKIAAKSGVIKDIKKNSTVGGYPAMNIIDWHRSTIKLKKSND